MRRRYVCLLGRVMKGDGGTSADGFDTGGLVNMGSATNKTTCVDGEIVMSGN